MPIQVLSATLAAQIAAGEVVERPVSVVKELIENSLDAGAESIIVDVEGGLCASIKVIDDGCGIPQDELDLALQHHATSKLSLLNELDNIATLGFRGEALPSISSVSKVTITSRHSDSISGHRINYDFGSKVSESAVGTSIGTAVLVARLFENVPARLKFLRSNSAELSRVKDLMQQYAMGYPAVKFQLRSDSKTLFSTTGSGNILDPVIAIYGSRTAPDMIRISQDETDQAYRVEGFVSVPALNRANRSYMTLFVNGRLVSSRTMTHAVEEAYHGLLPERRYPISVLNLVLPYSDVDVNAHPTKREIRFLNENLAYTSLQKAVRKSLIDQVPVSTVGRTTFTGRSSGGIYPYPTDRTGSGSYSQMDFVQGRTDLFSTQAPNRELLTALHVIGQVRSTYIIADGPDGFYVIDQHAAHERVLFDGIVEGLEHRYLDPQILLAPVTVNLSPLHVETLHNHKELLSKYGFDVQEFDSGAYLLRSVPSMMSVGDPSKSLVDVLDMISVEGLLRRHEEIVAASVACHSAVRAGRVLRLEEMNSLVQKLEATTNPHTCPHGRPTLVRYADYQTEREFGRR